MDCDPGTRAHPVECVIPVTPVIDIHVVGLVPVRRPRLRPRIHERNPITVVLEARIPAYEDHRKAADAKEVVISEGEAEARVGDAVAVIAATLAPGAVIVIPRVSARLCEAAVHLSFVLRNAAVVYAPMGWAIPLDSAVISAAVALARCSLPLRRPAGLLALCGPSLLVLLAWLMLLPLLTFALLLTLLPVLGEGNRSGSEE